MSRRILLIDGHPDPAGGHLCQALLDAYAEGARVVVTMGMPAFVYRWVFGAHSLKSLERNILRFCGIRPIRETLVGSVETASPHRCKGWFAAMRAADSRGD